MFFFFFFSGCLCCFRERKNHVIMTQRGENKVVLEMVGELYTCGLYVGPLQLACPWIDTCYPIYGECTVIYNLFPSSQPNALRGTHESGLILVQSYLLLKRLIVFLLFRLLWRNVESFSSLREMGSNFSGNHSIEIQ